MTKVKDKETPKKQRGETIHESPEVAAYLHWLESGCPMDDDLANWMEVERKYAVAARHN